MRDGEFGIGHVQLRLWGDSNGSGMLDAGDEILARGVSAGDGRYRFGGLEAGDYLVEVIPENFAPDGLLADFETSRGNDDLGQAPDPDDDVNNDDNGSAHPEGGVASKAIHLGLGEEPAKADDGDDSNGNATLDFGFIQRQQPTGIDLGGFRALPSPQGGVLLEWWTEREWNVAGFDLLRADRADGPWIRLNSSLLPSSGDRAGGRYTFEDAAGRAGSFYRLEVLEDDGSRRGYGPVPVLGASGEAAGKRLYLPLLVRAQSR